MYCPDRAVEKVEGGAYEINYDVCKGCGICAEECPSEAIEMVEEDQ
jgi:pyruvate ferredoxin oxidoreductase delta subunit